LNLPSDEEDEDDDDGVEEAYAAKRVASRLKSLAQGGKQVEEDSDEEEDEEEDEESELDIENLMHESLMPKMKKMKMSKADEVKVPTLAKPVKKPKIISTDTPEERDARTIFIGNVPVECSTSRVSITHPLACSCTTMSSFDS
jgi:nucleolar protein 12